MNVAQAMVEAFVQEGVDVATGIAGMSIVEFANAVCSNPAIRVCYARHERGAADIADGYGRVTGKPAVVFADAGPGVANNMAGILNSFGDSTPMIFVASQPDRRTLGWRSYKEFPIHDVFTPVTKWTTSIGDPSQVAPTVRRAFTLLRSGRPGPVVIELASDVAAMPVGDFHYEPLGERIRNPGNPAEIERAVGLLGLAQSPYLYAGAGVLMSRAEEELVALSELLTLPVATSLNGKSAFPENHPLSLGLGGFPRGRYGTRHATEWAKQADVILTIGCSFQPPAIGEEFSRDFKMIQVDVDAAELHKKRRADVAILGDAKVVLQQLVAAAKTLLPASRLAAREDTIQAVARGRADWLALGLVMGLGLALREEFVPGETHGFREYQVPRLRDVPEIVPVIMEVPDEYGPFGAKGMGEHTLIPTLPAITNAIADATGVRILKIPVEKSVLIGKAPLRRKTR